MREIVTKKKTTTTIKKTGEKSIILKIAVKTQIQGCDYFSVIIC